MANEFSIDTYKQQFETGARSYMFYFEPQFPRDLGVTLDKPNARFLVKTATLPSSSVEEMITPWQGFDYKTGGKRMYNDLMCTFNVDLNANVRKAFLKWQDMILDPQTNKHAYPSQYFTVQNLVLLGLQFEPILTYKLHFAWPGEVGDLQLDYAQTTEIASFDVTFKYTYFTWSDRPVGG
jgi:hypothetical protein